MTDTKVLLVIQILGNGATYSPDNLETSCLHNIFLLSGISGQD